jgi:hypothetical protein
MRGEDNIERFGPPVKIPTMEELQAKMDAALARRFKIGGAFFDKEMTYRLERAADRFRAVAEDDWDTGRLVVEALEARLEVLEAAGR